MPVKTGEQVVDRLALAELLAEQPDCLGVRHLVAQPQPEEAHERQTVIDDKFGLIVGQIVKRLQHEDIEHQHRIEGRTATLCPIRPLQSLRQRLAEHLPRHDSVQLLQWITGCAQPRIALIHIPEPRLSPHRSPPQITAVSKSGPGLKHQAFEMSSRLAPHARTRFRGRARAVR